MDLRQLLEEVEQVSQTYAEAFHIKGNRIGVGARNGVSAHTIPVSKERRCV